MRVGSGSLAFELVEGWERLPNGFTHPDVAAVCADSSGNVYMYCRGEHPVMVYDREGKFIDSWGEGRFTYRTHGMFMGTGDELFLVDDGANAVTRHALDGTLIEAIGPVGEPTDTGYVGELGELTHAAGPYNRPTNVSTGPTGDIYVSDGYANCRVHRFNRGGELQQSWGEIGRGPGEFRIPHSVWAHADGRVFVADRENERIQIFGPSGEYLTEWTDVQRPQDIFIDKDGLVYVAELSWAVGNRSFGPRGPIAEYVPARLSIFDPEGNVLLRWSDPDPTKAGYFIAPHGIWVDNEGSIYLAEVTYTVAGRRGLAPPDAHTFQKFARV